ncbi:hypothetical protein HELRODRAFT_193096 [Helobdella robusta]|uniref:Thyrotropin-releasing hormone receptor n=1 Tax=Helobdella robusta TaxID=6412 RepID=T1FUM5_HELRO|nr:hypothetical protein HELRODRAFT_193096 [Helobdella robusta]ESN98119.1 hypothetical protein HELRODRAFT_193096 [Helobdella robusta]
MGNSIVFLVIMLSKQIRSTVNFFLANLALADLFVGVFCIIPNLISALNQEFISGWFTCKTYFFVRSLNYSVSILILTIVSLERYFVIVNPILSRRFANNLTIRSLIISGVWVICILYALPYFLIYNYQCSIVNSINVSEVIADFNESLVNLSSNFGNKNGDFGEFLGHSPSLVHFHHHGGNTSDSFVDARGDSSGNDDAGDGEDDDGSHNKTVDGDGGGDGEEVYCYCLPTHEYIQEVYSIIDFTCFYVVPLVLMSIVYIRISRVLWSSEILQLQLSSTTATTSARATSTARAATTAATMLTVADNANVNVVKPQQKQHHQQQQQPHEYKSSYQCSTKKNIDGVNLAAEKASRDGFDDIVECAAENYCPGNEKKLFGRENFLTSTAKLFKKRHRGVSNVHSSERTNPEQVHMHLITNTSVRVFSANEYKKDVQPCVQKPQQQLLFEQQNFRKNGEPKQQSHRATKRNMIFSQQHKKQHLKHQQHQQQHKPQNDFNSADTSSSSCGQPSLKNSNSNRTNNNKKHISRFSLSQCFSRLHKRNKIRRNDQFKESFISTSSAEQRTGATKTCAFEASPHSTTANNYTKLPSEYRFQAPKKPFTSSFSSSVKSSTNVNKPSMRARQKVVRLLIAMVSMFALCMLPEHLYFIIKKFVFIENFTVDFCLLLFLRLLFCSYSAINPILYSLLSRKFRKVLCSRCAKY